ncbi:hypothetical protein HTS61_14850 [Escherichia coli]|nr:hypothetical protein [Escherichia coli]
MMMSKKIGQKAPASEARGGERTCSYRQKIFGYEEMLSELEAIVADAETRLAEDEATA